MSLRVTQRMMFDNATRDIHSGLLGYSRLQQQVATGRRVNAPSDDPAAALRILPLTAELRNLDQLTDNVTLSRQVLDTGASTLEDGSSILTRARELTTQAATGSLNEGDRRAIALEIGQLLEQMVGVGNARRGGRYLFGGTVTDQPPFELVSSGSSSRVVYNGNAQSVVVEVAPGVNTELNVPGDSIFTQHQRGATEFSQTSGQSPTGAQPGSGTDSGVGFGDLNVSFNGLHTDAPAEITAGSGTQGALGSLTYTFATGPDRLSIDGGPDIAIPATDTTFTTGDGREITLSVSGVGTPLTGTMTAKAGLSTDGGQSLVDVSDFTQSNVQVLNGDDGTVLNVDVQGLTQTGDEIVKFSGTFDAFNVLIALRDLLTNDAGVPDQEVTKRVSGLLDEIDSAHNGILDGLRELGFRSSSMDLLQSRVENLKISRAEALSLAQDTDLSDAILELQRQDIAYQASLQVASRVVSTNLTGFLR